MDNLQRVLLIDDEYEQLEVQLSEDFQEQGIDIRFCGTKDEALALLNSGIYFDLIILDWFLEEDNNLLSRLILNYLQNNCFLPVFIWSNHITNYQETLAHGEITYPAQLIQSIGKEDVSPAIIQERTAQWFQNSLTAQISGIYRRQIRQGLEKIFFNLVQLPNQDLAALLKSLVGEGEIIDWSNDFILNLLHQELIGNAEFCEDLNNLLNQSHNISEPANAEERRQILSKILYYTSHGKYLRCGDIVQFQVNKDTTKLGIVVTPLCDLAQKRTRFIELVELTPFQNELLEINIGKKQTIENRQKQVKDFNHPSFHFFPVIAIDKQLIDFVAVLKSKMVIEYCFEQSPTHPYPSIPERIAYTGKFCFAGVEIQLIAVCSLNDPYKSHFLQKLHTHNSRVGTPEITKLI